MDEEQQQEEVGLPGWVMTFADLMTLLMCFYVLMLSFSEMDVAKFKQLAGSVKDAFGVQTDINVKNMPKGTSIIAREFRPGKPQPTPVDTIRQFTVNSNQNTLEFGQGEDKKDRLSQEELAKREAERIRKALQEEIDKGTVLVRSEGVRVIVHILEQGSFRSGKARLEAAFVPVMAKMRGLLADMSGAITVSGHTDDLPISNAQFRSNWDLSAARAASVAHELLKADSIDARRVMISGHADTQPRIPNDTAVNRAKNRRIDITVAVGEDLHKSWTDLEVAEAGDEPEASGAEPAETGP